MIVTQVQWTDVEWFLYVWSLPCDLSEYNVLLSQCEGILSTKILQSDQTTLYRSNYLKYLCSEDLQKFKFTLIDHTWVSWCEITWLMLCSNTSWRDRKGALVLCEQCNVPVLCVIIAAVFAQHIQQRGACRWWAARATLTAASSQDMSVR